MRKLLISTDLIIKYQYVCRSTELHRSSVFKEWQHYQRGYH